jgi:hypothetical protein
MSALGQSRHMRRKTRCPLYPNSDRKSGFPHKVMSALPPKADGSEKQMSALCVVDFVIPLLTGATMAVEFSLPKQWEDWCSWLLGLWLCISPWAKSGHQLKSSGHPPPHGG